MRLIESQADRDRRPGGAATSVVFHAAMIAAAVVGTARADAGPRIIEPSPREVLYRPPSPPAPTTATARTSSTGTAAGPTAPGTVIQPPTSIAEGIPPVDVEVGDALARHEPVTIGGGGSRSMGGFDQPGGGGAPGEGGVWDGPTVEIPVVPDPRNPVPTYPEPLRQAGIAGRVLAEFVVDSTGRVRPGSLQVVESSHPQFASSVRRTVPSLRFAPARVRGAKVAQRVRMPFEFEVSR